MAHSFFSWAEYKTVVQDLFKPDEQHLHVWDIDLQALKDSGFSTILLDIDNTVLSRHQKNLSLRHLNWMQKCKDMGFHVIIFSNNRSRKRIKRVCEQSQCKGYYLVCKPFAFSARALAKKYGFDFSKTVVVGDQVFTDILMGKWIKSHSILVEPIDKKLSLFKRIQYQLERSLISSLA